MLYRFLKYCFIQMVSLVDIVLPKKYQFCIYITNGTYWDANLQILHYYLINETSHKVRLLDGNDLSRSGLKNYFIVYWHLISSKFIIYDHSIPLGLISKKHVRVNLWHGTPFKKIRFHLLDFQEQTRSVKQAKITDIVCSNSDYDALLMSASMNIPRFNVLSTGLPRNDYLLSSNTEVVTLDVNQYLQQLSTLKFGFCKSILWAPTYRGGSREWLEPIDLSEEQQEKLCNFLEKENVCLWLRTHKFSKLKTYNRLLNHPNIKDVSDITNTNLILRETDILITDYSSIWVDFLLVDKPIVFYAQDYAEYQKQRGFILDYKRELPTPLLDCFDQLLKSLELNLKNSDFIGYDIQKQKYHVCEQKANKTELIYKAIIDFRRVF